MEIEQIRKEITEIKDSLKELEIFLRKTDIKTNSEIAKLLGYKSKKTLLNWYAKGCPRVDSTHASFSEVKQFIQKSTTKQE